MSITSYDQWATAAPPEQICPQCKAELGEWENEEGEEWGGDTYCSKRCAMYAEADRFVRQTPPRTTSDDQLARLWLGLAEMRRKIDSEIMPLALYCDVEDDELLTALTVCASAIQSHLQAHKLQAVKQ